MRSLLLIAEEMNLTRAAERLDMAQPHLTRLLHRLEEELGFLVFDRSNKRQLALTPAGEAFLEGLSPLLTQYDHSLQVAQRINRGEAGNLVVGYTSAAIYSKVLPAILRAYQRFPEVELSLLDLSTHPQRAQLAALSKGKIDVALFPQTPPVRGLEQECFARGNWILALPITHPKAGEERISLASLNEEEWIGWPRSLAPNIYDAQMAFFRQAGFEPRLAQSAQQGYSMINLVADGRGIALMSPWTPQGITHPQVVYRPLLEALPVELHVLWRKGERSPLVQTFLQVVREVREKL
jgi:DNA-binding transcriptional LysR family regulator